MTTYTEDFTEVAELHEEFKQRIAEQEKLITYLIKCVNDYEVSVCGEELLTRDNVDDMMREFQEG